MQHAISTAAQIELQEHCSLETEQIASALAGNPLMRQLRETYLLPLVSYDAANGTDYVDFICNYLSCDGHINDIADKMYIHRNTVHYKIHRVEGLLHCNLQRSDVKMYLLLALSSQT